MTSLLRSRMLLLACTGLFLTLASGHPAAQPPTARDDSRRHVSQQPPPDDPADDSRVSSMGRLARLAATGRLKRAIARARAARETVSPDDDDSGDGPAGGQAETSIAVDSTGQHIVVGTNDTRGFTLNPLSVSGFAYSDNGGVTFVDGGQLPVTVATSTIGTTIYPQVFGDPEVKYLGGSTFVYFSIVVKKIGTAGTAQTMGLHRSTDFGHTWQGPFEIIPATNPHGLTSGANAVDAGDKEFADVDPDTGRVMFTWTNFTSTIFAPGGAEISSTFSDNVATATPPTWSARKIIANSAADGQASIPRFAGNGSQNVYIAWRRFPGGNSQNVGFARSTDNGSTFTSAVSLATSFFTMDQVLGNDRNGTSPALAVDNSPGAFKGTIYLTYSNNDNHDGADVMVQRSIDQGLSFSAPVRINSRPGSDRAQWFPWVTVDTTTGRAWVFYYDQAIASDGDLTETTCQYSDDGGATWSKPAPLSDRPFHAGYGNDTGQPNLGDYNQAVARGGELFAVWAGNPPLVGFADGQPSSASMTVPDMTFKRLAAASPRLAVALGHVSFADTGAAPLAGNGFIDPGEQIAFTIPLTNYVTNPLTAGAITGISATLTTTTPGVLVLQGSSSYSSLAAGATSTNASSYTLTTAPAFLPGTHIDLALNVTSAQGSTTLPFTRATGTPFATTLLSENFNGVAAGSLPAGWTPSHAGGSKTVPWTTSNQSLGAGPATISNAAFHANANDGTPNANSRFERLFSPQFVVPASAEYVTVDFDAAYDTEDDPAFNIQAFDGFLLRVADLTPGRALRSVQVEAFAEEFTTGSASFYPKHMPRSSDANYLQDLSAWAGDSAGYRHVHLKLPGMAGATAQLRFEYTQDFVGICTNVRPGHRCGVLVDNVVVQSVQSVTPTTVTLTSSANPSAAGQPVTFTATVTTSTGFFATGGTVTFTDGSTTLAGPLPLSNGQAVFSTSSLGPRTHAITAQYSSGSGLVGASSAGVAQHVVVTAGVGNASLAEGNSGISSAVFQVSLSQASPETVAIDYATADGTATVADHDYALASGTVTFAPGEMLKTIAVSVFGDAIAEADETFTVNFTNPVNVILTNTQGAGTILNDDSGPIVDETTVRQAITNGGARLKALQNSDGGWEFRVGLNDCGSGGASCPNTFGVTALGLLAAYTRSSDASFLTAATTAGDALVARYNVAVTETPPKLPLGQDIEFLEALAQATGRSLYATTAQAWFQVAVARFPNAADRIDDLVTHRNGQGRRSAAAWDAASFIRAAKAVGNASYALAAANRIRDREPDWKDTDSSHRFDKCPNPAGCGPSDNPLAFDDTLLGEGSLLWAIHDLPGFDAQIAEYRSFLLAQQDPGGSWDVGSTQVTSYAVLGLAAVGGAGADAGMHAAGGFFIAQQLAPGGWPFSVSPSGNGVEIAEIDGEAVRALATLFSTPAGSSVAVAPAQLSTVTFSTVASAGTTSVVAINPATAATVTGGFQVVGDLTYEVTTTAAISGTITVCFSVPWIGDAGTFANVRILHGEGGVLVDRTILPPDQPAPDFAARRVCARVSSLSPFAIAVKEAVADTVPPDLSVTLVPSVLKPGDGRWVAVTATIYVADDTDPAPSVTLVSITSDESGERGRREKEERDVRGAAFGTDDRAFELRAERDGRDADRTYTVVYRATDRSGNHRDVTTQVVVARQTRCDADVEERILRPLTDDKPSEPFQPVSSDERLLLTG